MSTILPLPSSPHWAPSTAMFVFGIQIYSTTKRAQNTKGTKTISHKDHKDHQDHQDAAVRWSARLAGRPGVGRGATKANPAHATGICFCHASTNAGRLRRPSNG